MIVRKSISIQVTKNEKQRRRSRRIHRKTLKGSSEYRYVTREHPYFFEMFHFNL
jgi:hypothetical protein